MPHLPHLCVPSTYGRARIFLSLHPHREALMLFGGYFGFGITTTPPTGITKPPDPRLKPVRGDEIDELVNQQLARGASDAR